jgi:hypothetical protein
MDVKAVYLYLPIEQLSSFLCHLSRVYRTQNSYHNFQHALDVLQATHMFLSTANIIPHVSILLSDDHQWQAEDIACNPRMPELTNQDIFALFLAAIGHDVGHPGFSNAFMVMHLLYVIYLLPHTPYAEKCQRAVIISV